MLDNSLRAEFERQIDVYRKVLPECIFEEHCTGENICADLLSLDAAYRVYAYNRFNSGKTSQK